MIKKKSTESESLCICFIIYFLSLARSQAYDIGHIGRESTSYYHVATTSFSNNALQTPGNTFGFLTRFSPTSIQDIAMRSLSGISEVTLAESSSKSFFIPTISKSTVMPASTLNLKKNYTPTIIPTIAIKPTSNPTTVPSTSKSSCTPSMKPTIAIKPTSNPTTVPLTSKSSYIPSMKPTIAIKPTSNPTTVPLTSKSSCTPSMKPTIAIKPTSNPTTVLSTSKSSCTPSMKPTIAIKPTSNPTTVPLTSKSSYIPSMKPTIAIKPTSNPTTVPSTSKSSYIPSMKPTIAIKPTSNPTTVPLTSKSSCTPSMKPTIVSKSTIKPTITPTITGKSNAIYTVAPTIAKSNNKPIVMVTTNAPSKRMIESAPPSLNPTSTDLNKANKVKPENINILQYVLMISTLSFCMLSVGLVIAFYYRNQYPIINEQRIERFKTNIYELKEPNNMKDKYMILKSTTPSILSHSHGQQSYETSGIEEYIPSNDDDVDLEAFYADDDDNNEEDNLIKSKNLYKR